MEILYSVPVDLSTTGYQNVNVAWTPGECSKIPIHYVVRNPNGVALSGVNVNFGIQPPSTSLGTMYGVQSLAAPTNTFEACVYTPNGGGYQTFIGSNWSVNYIVYAGGTSGIIYVDILGYRL